MLTSATDMGNGNMVGEGEDRKYAIEAGLLGFVNSSYQLGSIFGVPIAPWFANRYGRRWSIMLGSCIMIVGALLQGFAQHGKRTYTLGRYENSGTLAYTVEKQLLCTSFLVCCSVSASCSASFLVPP